MKNDIVKYGLFGIIALIGVGILSKLLGGKIPTNTDYLPPGGANSFNTKPGGCGCGMKK